MAARIEISRAVIWQGRGYPASFFGSIKSSLSRLLCIGSFAAAFHQKQGEVRGERLGGKLPHHQRDLTPVVSGMVRQMLHEVRQTDLCCAKRKHPSQGFVC